MCATPVVCLDRPRRAHSKIHYSLALQGSFRGAANSMAMRALVLLVVIVLCATGGLCANITALPVRPRQRYKGTRLECPPPVSLAMPDACKSKNATELCADCVDTLTNATLASLPAYPCDVPDTFLLSCMLPYMPSFVRLGGNATGLGSCNKTELSMQIASRTKCIDASGNITTVDYHIPLRAFRAMALAETGGASLRTHPDEYKV